MTEYLVNDGTRAMAANLDMAQNDIVNVDNIEDLDQIQSDFVTLIGTTPTFRISGTGVHDIFDDSGALELASDAGLFFSVDTNAEAGFFRGGTDNNLRYSFSYSFPNDRDVVDKGYVDAGDASDIRIKSQFQPFEEGLDVVLGLEPKRFKWTQSPHAPTREVPEIGLVGQEVEQVAPDVVTLKDTGPSAEGASDNVPDFHMVHYSKLTMYLINAVKELNARLSDAEDTIVALQENL